MSLPKTFIKKVKRAMKEVEHGCPLKDFLDDDEIERALYILIEIADEWNAEQDAKVKVHFNRTNA